MDNIKNLPQVNQNQVIELLHSTGTVENIYCRDLITLTSSFATVKNSNIPIIGRASGWGKITFRNCLIESVNFNARDDNSFTEIEFDNVGITNLTFAKGKILKLTIKESNIVTLLFENGEYNSINISTKYNSENLYNEGISGFRILNGQYGGISFTGAVIRGFLISGGTFNSIRFSGRLNLGMEENKYSPNNILIEGGVFKSFLFEDCYVLFPFSIVGGVFESGIVFKRHIHFVRSFKISGGEFKKPITMGEYQTKMNQTKPLGKFFNKIIISSNCNGFVIEGNNSYNLIFIVSLVFNYLPSYTSINNIKILSLSIQSHDTTLESSFSISNSKINNVSFVSFNNHGRMTFNNMSPLDKNDMYFGSNLFPFFNGITKPDFSNIAKEFEIKESNLGVFDLISCSLFEYDLFIDSSKLINIFYTNSIFPNPENIKINKGYLSNHTRNIVSDLRYRYERDYKNNVNPNLSIRNKGFLIYFLYYINRIVCQFFPYSQFPNPSKIKALKEYASLDSFNPTKNLVKLKNVFEQLHTVAAKQGDLAQAITWQAMAQKYQMNLLKYKRTGKWMPYQFQQDWFILFLNWISNDFRRSIWRGIVFTFVVGVVFYSLYILLMDSNIRLCFDDCNTWESIKYALSKYSSLFVEFMNPAHSFDFMKDAVKDVRENGEWPVFIATIVDFFGRAFVGYGIYQTIQAFRKFGKAGGE